MKIGNASFILAGAMLAASAMHAQDTPDTRESAIKGMRKVEAKEMDPGYKKSAPLAQALVDDALSKHPNVILMAIHAGAPKYDIIASNFGRIGKLGDEDDLRCIHTGKANLEVDKTGRHFEDEMAIKDKSGKTVGALGVVFNYKPGTDKAALQKEADEILKDMEARIKSEKALFGPA